MKNALAVGLLFVFFLLSLGIASGQETSELSIPPKGDHEQAEVSQGIGPVNISIKYHSPISIGDAQPGPERKAAVLCQLRH